MCATGKPTLGKKNIEQVIYNTTNTVFAASCTAICLPFESVIQVRPLAENKKYVSNVHFQN
jgi:hypothetical protein